MLTPEQRGAFERFVGRGGGFVGIHGAADTAHDWPLFGRLLGARFRAHPEVQAATVVVDDAGHPATHGLPLSFSHEDEWYAFDESPRQRVRVLLSLDESSYAPGDASMGGDHPIAWCHEVGRARAFYTGLGHEAAFFDEPAFLAHLAAGIEWAAKLERAGDQPP